MDRSRWMTLWVGLGLIIPTTGCCTRAQLLACQNYTCELQRRNQQLSGQYENLRLQNQELANKALDAEDRLAEQESLLSQYRQRIAEQGRERDQIAARALEGSRIPRDVRRKLEDFARRHPEFVEVDADAGISKFKSDVLFRTGEAVLLPESQAVLQEFASIFQGGSGQSMIIMVVGHTDRQRIAKPATKALHETNWHLAAHRAIAVEQYLESAGIEPRRMGVSGYGPHQPLDTGNSAAALARNRRVEIYVLAPDAPIVGRTDRGDQY
jgi:chemotaxis protein MotB